MNIYSIFLVLSVVSFMLAAFGYPPARVNLGWLGMALLVIALWVRT